MSTEPNQGTGAPGAPAAPAGYETRDANPGSLLRFGVGLALTLVVIWAGMWWLLGYYGRVQQLGPGATPFELAEGSQRPPMPRLQVEPVEDLALVRGQQHSALDSYGWVDRGQGIVRIPIERAMALILERHALPVRALVPAPVPAQVQNDAHALSGAGTDTGAPPKGAHKGGKP